MSTDEKRKAASAILAAVFLNPRRLAEMGLTRHRVAVLVAAGALVRVRKGRYVTPDTHPSLTEAARYGGRLDCVSLLALLGVFVRENRASHLQFTPGTTRLPVRPRSVIAHWRTADVGVDALAVDVVGALVQACRCQSPRDAIATLDSAWHHGLIDEADVAEIFRRLPRRFRPVRGLLDPRSESGAETLMRLLLIGLGCEVELQVVLPGVGRVDLIVDGWLIVECDSRAFHEGWPAQMRDRRRDLAAAALGYTTIRPLAEDILYRREDILATIKAILAHPRTSRRARLQNSTDPRAKRGFVR
jgi:very-short-patch-repair endonuclease